MRFVIDAVSLLVVFMALAGSKAAPSASSSSASGPTTREWNLPKNIYIRKIYPAGELVFAYGSSMSGTIFYCFKLDTKTGKWTDANELIPQEVGSSPQTLDTVFPSPDGRHALMGCTYASPPFERQLYSLEIGNDNAVTVKVSLPEGSKLSTAVWRGNDSFFVGAWDSVNGRTSINKPILFDATGKKIREWDSYIFILGASTNGKVIIGVGDPDRLTEPLEPGNFNKLGRLLVMDENLKVLTTIDAMPVGTISPNGKYVGIRRKIPSSQSTTARFENRSVISTDGKWEGPVLSNRDMIAIYTCDDGDLLCIKQDPRERERSALGDQDNALVRWDRQGKETVLLEHVRAATVSGDSLDYIQGDKLKAVKLSELK